MEGREGGRDENGEIGRERELGRKEMIRGIIRKQWKEN